MTSAVMPSQTFSGRAIIFGLVAAAAASAQPAHVVPAPARPELAFDMPFGTMSNSVVSYDLVTAHESFGDEVARFYHSLQTGQTELDADFRKVLVDNLWDLYSA